MFMRKEKITINTIEEDLSELDTEYREALAHCLVDLKYLSDTPLRLSIGNYEQQRELEKVRLKPLSDKQIMEIIKYISDEMKNDYQYGRFKNIASVYMNRIGKNKKSEEKKDMKKVYNENEVREFLISEAKNMLNEIEMHNMDIEIALVDRNNIENSKVIAMREDGEGGDIIYPYLKEFKGALEWNYSFDEHLFKELQNGMEIIYITDETHLAIWHDIKEYYPEDIRYNKGMQKYLEYCKEKGITKEYIEKTSNQRNVVDVMQFYKNTKKKEMER